VFYQFGVNDSQTLPINQYYGAGVTGFGLIGNRERDSMGFGVGVSRTKPEPVRPSDRGDPAGLSPGASVRRGFSPQLSATSRRPAPPWPAPPAR
ncbi:MAG TPA: carbohydrate porin, partial [Reyranella sp.]